MRRPSAGFRPGALHALGRGAALRRRRPPLRQLGRRAGDLFLAVEQAEPAAISGCSPSYVCSSATGANLPREEMDFCWELPFIGLAFRETCFFTGAKRDRA
jgi:hypothetical protein